MTDPINTQNRPRSSGISADTRTDSAAKTGAQSAQPGSAPRSAGDATIVELSNPTLLEELAEQIRNLPEVNEARIEAVKQALSNGEYTPDAEVIARKYSEIEKLLP